MPCDPAGAPGARWRAPRAGADGAAAAARTAPKQLDWAIPVGAVFSAAAVAALTVPAFRARFDSLGGVLHSALGAIG